jgi:thiamine pyrophosphokinase
MHWSPNSSLIALVANGEISGDLRSFETIVAVDGGLVALDRMGISPHLITGDFDSVPLELLEKYKHIPQLHTPDQEHSDLEKAIDFLLRFQPEKLRVFGALGKRADHLIANILLLSRYPEKLVFESFTETLYVINNKSLIKTTPGQTLSLIPLNGPVSGITTRGLKWELANATLDKHFVGLSNVSLNEEIDITHESGDLLLCLNKRLV